MRWGDGLLESAYQACLAYELLSRGIEAGCNVALIQDGTERMVNGF